MQARDPFYSAASPPGEKKNVDAQRGRTALCRVKTDWLSREQKRKFFA
jgi:hypothetical protein